MTGTFCKVCLLACCVLIAACGDDGAGPSGENGTNGNGGTSGGASNGESTGSAGSNNGADEDANGVGSTGESNTGGDSGTASTGSTGESLTLRAYCEASYAKRAAWEPWIADCCDDEAPDAPTFPFLEYGEEYIESCTDNIQDVLDRGTVVFHGEHAKACADEETAAFPESVPGCKKLELNVLDAYYWGNAKQRPDCRAAFEGKLAMGEKCGRDMECKSGLTCIGSGSSFTCQPIAKENGRCDGTLDCEDGLRCAGGVGTATCRKPNGTAGAPCTTKYDCATGLGCSIDRACVQLGGVGASCDTSFDCQPNLTCNLSSKCEGLPPKADGNVCAGDSECVSTWCKDGTCTSFCGP